MSFKKKGGPCTRQCNFGKTWKGVDYCKSCGMTYEKIK